MEIEPKNTDALTNLAAMLGDLGKVSRATDIHLYILQLEPNSPDHLNNYAAFLQKIGKFYCSECSTSCEVRLTFRKGQKTCFLM